MGRAFMAIMSSCMRRLALASALLLAGFAGKALADGFSALHIFQGFPTDGGTPYSDLIADSSGNLYGTTNVGGKNLIYGSVYKIAPDGTETILYSFPPNGNGAFPQGRLLLLNGDLYGTTVGGGKTNVGTIFKLAANGTETVLYEFCKELKNNTCPDGAYPKNGLVSDDAGNLYGVTEYGGSAGGGVAFKLATDGTFSLLHTFCTKSQCSDGAYPYAELTLDASGNVYGTAGIGGGNLDQGPDTGCGVVFQITPSGSYKILHAFKGGSEGAFPQGSVVRDAAGNLYGTTTSGGVMDCSTLKTGCGTIYRLAPDGTIAVLYAFKGGLDGGTPLGQLLRDGSGNLYGTTAGPNDELGFATVFKLSPKGREKALHVFCVNDGNCLHGVRPTAGLVLVGDTFYGTTPIGGAPGWGVVFKLPKK